MLMPELGEGLTRRTSRSDARPVPFGWKGMPDGLERFGYGWKRFPYRLGEIPNGLEGIPYGLEGWRVVPVLVGLWSKAEAGFGAIQPSPR